jgi:peroxiredoxin (alkyl hydroperoxide reductase subunit C)
VLSLDAYRGEWVALFFYPRDFTFVCPTELRVLAELQDEFADAGAHVLAASTDSYWSHRAWFGSEPALADVRYPVLADTSLALGGAYGVLGPDGSALRATFVIDPAGVIRHASVSDQAIGRNPGETLRVVHALQTGELCPVDWRPGTPTLRLAA